MFILILEYNKCIAILFLFFFVLFYADRNGWLECFSI